MQGRADVEDWLAQIAQTIPYPHMRECSSSAEGEGLFAGSSNGSRKFILDRLFCLVNVPSLPDFESIVTGIEPTDHLPATEAVVTDRGMVADGKNPFQIMIPLSDPCMRELLATILPKSSESSTRSQCGLRAIDLLPDHARYRYSEYPSPSPSERVDDSDGKCSHDKCTDSLINGVTGNDGESVHMLRHKYFLLPGTELLDGVDSDRGNRLELNSQGGSSDCFYFVQLDDGDNEDSSSKIDQSSSHSCCLEEDDNTLRQLLRSIPPSKIDVASTQTNASRTHDGLPDYQHGTFKERAENGSDNGPSANGVVQGSPSAPKKWDISVLSTICRWRSCLCKGGKASPYLCTYHNELKSFLDIKSSSSAQSDASKYLPRKSPAIGQSNTPSGHNLGLAATAAAGSRMDLTTIRAASTLLQELWDGKLKSTLRSFVKKTTHDMRLKKRLQAASAKGMLSHEKYLASCVPGKAVGAGATAISRVGGENGRIRNVSVTSTTLKNLPLPKPPGDSTPNKPKPSKVPGPNTGFSLSIMAMPALPESPQWSVWKDRDLFNK